MINVLLFGPPGAGKGTQADLIVEHFSLEKLSTGQYIRDEIARGTELGLEAERQMEGGKLASDEIVVGIVAKCVEQHVDTKGIIFDGFPRTENQAHELDVILAKIDRKVNCLISLEVETEELIRRMQLRAKVSGRADDNNDAVMRNRLAVYAEKTEIVKEHYRKLGCCYEIDGAKSIEEIASQIRDIIEKCS